MIVCLLSLVISMFALNYEIDVNIPFTNKVVWTNRSEDSANFTGKYTALRAQTFTQNLYGDFIILIFIFIYLFNKNIAQVFKRTWSEM